MSSYSQTTIVLNDFGLSERTRTSLKTGKSTKRMTVQIRSEPIIHSFAPLELGKGPAEAIRDVIVDKIKNIEAVASPSTLKRREYARKRFEQGASWEMQRYAGGRIGALPPAQSVRLFNDSGRLANITIQPNRAKSNADEGTWEVNVPANRFSETSWNGSYAQLIAMIERLQIYVPELGNPQALADNIEVRKAVAASIENVLIQLNVRNRELRSALRQARIDLASQIIGGMLELTL